MRVIQSQCKGKPLISAQKGIEHHVKQKDL